MQNSPYGIWAPWNASSHGDRIDGLITVLHWFMALLFIGWGIFFVYCLIRFRRREGHTASYQLPKGTLSKYAEIGVMVFEVILLVGFSVPVWGRYKNDPPAPDKRVDVRVIAQQFQWNFHYPGKDGKFGRTDPNLIKEYPPLGLDPNDPDGKDDIVTTELHVPVSAPGHEVWVYAQISSKDVIHSFDIPVLRVKQDAIPGMMIPVWFQAMRTTDEFRQAMTKDYELDSREFQRMKAVLVATQNYGKGADGKPIVTAGFVMSDSDIDALKSAGITKVTAAPKAATEVVCAQLCGNSHFKMKAPLYMQKYEEFMKWMEHPAGAPSESKSEDFE